MSFDSGTNKYVARQGDHVAQLAFRWGVEPEDVWDHPANSDLKAKRQSMDVLYPGDVVSVPQRKDQRLSIEKGTTNRYTATVPRRTLSIALASTDGPYANQPYELHGLPSKPGAPLPKGTTGAKGEIQITVPVTQREVGVLLPNPNIIYHLRIGEVDPMSEPTGPQKRLENLGYLERGKRHDAETVHYAVRAFQAKEGLPVTGELDATTHSKLTEVSGQEG